MPSPTLLIFPSPRDDALKEYSNQQQSQVSDRTLKARFQKACELALAEGLDLEQIDEDQNPSFFTDRDIKIGLARRFIRDIKYWVKKYKCANGVVQQCNLDR